jgi:hypothetical protein
MTTLPTIGGWTTTTSWGSTATGNIAVNINVASGGVQTNDWIVNIVTSGGPYSTSRRPSFDASWTTIVPFAQVGAGTTCFGIYARKRLAGDSSSYGVPQTTVEASAIYSRLIFVRGADDIANWVLGTFNPRGVNGTSATNVATSINTAIANTLALLLSEGRTVAAETDAQVTCTNFTKVDFAMGTGTDHIVLFGTKAMVAPGATAGSTITYPNTHVANGIAGILGIPPVPDVPDLGLAIKVSSAGVLKDTRLKVSSGTALYTPRAVKKIRRGYASVTDMLASPFIWSAHRGGSADFPELTAYAYSQSAIYDYPAMELSMARTSDGVWFGLHDASLDRTSLGTGGGSGTTLIAANMTWAQVQNYQVMGSAAINNPTQPARPYMRFEELMATYYFSHVIMLDPKVANAYRGELLNMMDAQPGNPRERLMGKYYGVSGAVNGSTGWAKELRDRGYKSWGYFYDTDQPNYATYAPRWDILGLNYHATQTYWDQLRAAAPGKKVLGHICVTNGDLNSAVARGADGAIVAGVVAVRPTQNLTYPY